MFWTGRFPRSRQREREYSRTKSDSSGVCRPSASATREAAHDPMYHRGRTGRQRKTQEQDLGLKTELQERGKVRGPGATRKPAGRVGPAQVQATIRMEHHKQESPQNHKDQREGKDTSVFHRGAVRRRSRNSATGPSIASARIGGDT